ncbi:acetyl-CoA carboxylase carboxyltransferase subunit alpha [Cricetibacter osteomyelitidis]|uniref:Acetyl-CoA carboxylase carboxyltransferase subunit alpha n=1 Tax=Cricetibacter osteomyelitidis TaxID=1521931 RepID=A0A4R2SY94_9PAST|nr:zinc ribbon domain-containing protein [Cricetibacter osteomyelitidis]TCP95509.1 acetyl-CoA carboxylase carboxyltransferase subunit alpha [Cricetibacter osteomyelitidis]
MAMNKCPECNKKVSESAVQCPNCGFSFDEKTAEKYRRAIENRRIRNQEINRKSAKLQLIWFVIFAVIISAVMIWNS